MQRSEQSGFFVIVIVALRPQRFGKRRIGAIPGARVFVGFQRAFARVGAAIAKGFIKTADAVVHRGDEHQITGRPGIEIAVSKNAGHSELGHVRDVARADHLPLVHQEGIDPGVVRAVADGVVVKIGHGFVQIVKHLRVPADVSVQHVLRELQRDAHGIAIIVVGHVLAPVNQRRIEIFGMGQVPFVDVDHAVAAIDFDDRCDQRDHAVANLANVRAFIDGQAVGKFHQRGRRARFRRVNRAGDVVDGNGLGDKLVGFGVIKFDACAGPPASRGARVLASRFLRLASEEMATAIISRPSSVVPMENTFTRGLAFSSKRM